MLFPQIIVWAILGKAERWQQRVLSVSVLGGGQEASNWKERGDIPLLKKIVSSGNDQKYILTEANYHHISTCTT